MLLELLADMKPEASAAGMDCEHISVVCNPAYLDEVIATAERSEAAKEHIPLAFCVYYTTDAIYICNSFRTDTRRAGFTDTQSAGNGGADKAVKTSEIYIVLSCENSGHYSAADIYTHDIRNDPLFGENSCEADNAGVSSVTVGHYPYPCITESKMITERVDL